MDHFGGILACFPGGKLHFSAAPCGFLTIRIKEEFWGIFWRWGKNIFPGTGPPPLEKISIFSSHPLNKIAVFAEHESSLSFCLDISSRLLYNVGNIFAEAMAL